MSGVLHTIFVHFVLATTYCGWAGSSIVIKLTLSAGTDLVLFGAWRILLACIIMWVFAICKAKVKLRVLLRNACRDIGWFLLATILFLISVFGCLYNLSIISPERVSMFYPCNIVFTVALSMCVGMEPVSSLRILAVIIAVAGVTLMEVSAYTESKSDDTGNLVFLGTSLEIFRQLCNATQTLVVRVLSNHEHPPTFITAVYISLSVLVGVGIAMARYFYVHEELGDLVFQWSTDSWKAMAYCVFITTCYGYNGISYAVKYVDPSIVAIYSCLVTIGIVVLSIFTFHQYPTTTEYFGGGLCLSGMLLAIYSQRSSRLQSNAPKKRLLSDEVAESLLPESVGDGERSYSEGSGKIVSV